ncbi:C4b-binding protein beta chain isoform X2 [Cavia porcellus]|uniref:C4b-binding protein beta chain isoform X2 n=1 Tax=Cavia porcellus TaxID=10141 RepID=UPI002FE1B025
MFCWIVSCLVFGWLTSASDAQSHPEIPSVKNSISIAEVVEGQIRGTYTCIQGYHLEGKKVFFSNASEEWDASTTQCRLGHCPDPVLENGDCDPPEKPAHGYFQGANFTSGSMVTYHCESRYRLVGTPKQQCVDGEWSGAPPVCELIPRSGFEEALLAFQENTDLCSAIENFVRRVKENGLTMEELKYSLEIEKAELMQKLLT